MPDNINREQYIITYDTSDLKRALDDVKRLQEAIDKLGVGGNQGTQTPGGTGGSSTAPTPGVSTGGGGGGSRSRGPSIPPQTSFAPPVPGISTAQPSIVPPGPLSSPSLFNGVSMSATGGDRWAWQSLMGSTAPTTAGDYGYGFTGVSMAGAGGVRGRPGMNMPGDESWIQSKLAKDQASQKRQDFIRANSQRGVALSPDWNDDAGGGGPPSIVDRFMGARNQGTGKREGGFAGAFESGLGDPEMWGRHSAWLIQSAVLYQVTGLIGKVFEGIGTVVDTSMNAATASSRLQMISGQGGGGALGGLLGAGAAYGLGPSDIFGISSQLTTLGMATPGGANALTRASASSTAYGLFQNPLQAAQLYAQAGGTYGMTPGASQDLALRALRGGAPDPAATLTGGMGLAGSGAMSVPASVGLLTAIQRTTGLPADAATSVAEALMNNPATALYASTVVGLPGGGTRPAGLDAILPQLTRTYATGSAAQRQAISGLAGEANRVALQDILTNPQFAATQAQIANDANATRDALIAERSNVGLNLQRIGANALNSITSPTSGTPDAALVGGVDGAIGGAINFLGYYGQSATVRAQQAQDITYAEHDARMKAAYAAGNISGPGGVLNADGSSPINKFTGNGGVITAGDYNRLMKIYATVEAKLVGTPGYNAEENLQRADFTIIGTPGNPMYTKMDKLDRVALTQAMQIAAMGLVGMQNMPGNFLQQNLEGAIVSGQLGFSSMTSKNVFSGGNRPADPFIVSKYTNAYNDYRAGERNPGAWTGGAGGGQSTSTAQPDQPPYTPTPTTGNVYLNGQKVGEAMSAVSEVDMDRTLRSNYSAGNGNAPVLGAPIP